MLQNSEVIIDINTQQNGNTAVGVPLLKRGVFPMKDGGPIFLDSFGNVVAPPTLAYENEKPNKNRPTNKVASAPITIQTVNAGLCIEQNSVPSQFHDDTVANPSTCQRCASQGPTAIVRLFQR